MDVCAIVESDLIYISDYNGFERLQYSSSFLRYLCASERVAWENVGCLLTARINDIQAYDESYIDSVNVSPVVDDFVLGIVILRMHQVTDKNKKNVIKWVITKRPVLETIDGAYKHE